jgi:hypothetical protein
MLVGFWIIAITIGVLVYTNPPGVEWEPLAEPKTEFWQANGIIHAVSDFIILLIPIPLLKQLPISKSQKFIVIAIFGLGFL